MRIAWLDRDRAIAEFAGLARLLVARDDRAIAVGLFGSLARRQALPGSDADLLIVLKGHPQRRWFDRIPEYADAFADASLPAEPFPYTLDELKQMAAAQSGFVHTILRELIPLSGDDQVWQVLKRAG